MAGRNASARLGLLAYGLPAGTRGRGHDPAVVAGPLVLAVLAVLAACAVERRAVAVRGAALEAAPVTSAVVGLAIGRTNARPTPLGVRLVLPTVDGPRAPSSFLTTTAVGPVHS